MEQLVRVVKCNDDGTAQVLHERQSACSGDCHKCSGCGAAKETMLLTADNPIGARPGQLVTVEASTGPVLAAAAVAYLLPLGLCLAGYLAAEHLWGRGGMGGMVAFAAGIGISVLYDRLVMKKKSRVYTITGFGEKRG